MRFNESLFYLSRFCQYHSLGWSKTRFQDSLTEEVIRCQSATS